MATKAITLSSMLVGCVLNLPVTTGDINGAKVNKIDVNTPTSSPTTLSTPSATQSSTPKPSPTPESIGRLTIMPDLRLLERFGGTIGFRANQPLFSIIVSAKGGNVTITKLRLTRTGDAPQDDDLLHKITLGGTDRVIVIAHLTNNQVEYSNPNGLVTVIDGAGPINIQVWVDTYISGVSLFLFNEKTVGFSLDNEKDVETLNGAKILATYPIKSQLHAFCCIVPA